MCSAFAGSQPPTRLTSCDGSLPHSATDAGTIVVFIKAPVRQAVDSAAVKLSRNIFSFVCGMRA